MLPVLPQKLIDQGLNWRVATPLDLKFILFSWLASLEDAWLKGEASTDLPISPKLADTVNDALDRAESDDKKTAQQAIRFLNRIFNAEMTAYIKKALLNDKPLVIYAEDTPEFIVAWGLKNEYVYTKGAFHNAGFATLLLNAMNSSRSITDYKCRTSKGIRLLKKLCSNFVKNVVKQNY